MDPIAKKNGMIRPEILIPWPYSNNPYCCKGKVRFDEDIPCSPYQLRHRALYEARAKMVVGTLDSLDTPFPIDQLTEEECLLFWQALPFDEVLKAIIYRRRINYELLVKYKVFDYFKEIPGICKKPTGIFMNLQPHLTELPIDKQLPFFAYDRFGSIAQIVMRSMRFKKNRPLKVLQLILQPIGDDVFNDNQKKVILEKGVRYESYTYTLDIERICEGLRVCGIDLSYFESLKKDAVLDFYKQCLEAKSDYKSRYGKYKLRLIHSLTPSHPLTQDDAKALYDICLLSDNSNMLKLQTIHEIIKNQIESNTTSDLISNCLIFFEKILDRAKK